MHNNQTNTVFSGDDYKSFALGVFHVMVPGNLVEKAENKGQCFNWIHCSGTVISLLGFYGVLHSWLNAFAEITRFGDRHVKRWREQKKEIN